MNPHLLPKVRSEALKKACAGMPCTLRIASFIPGYKCSGNDTVVGAHLPVFGKGVNTKVSDLYIAAACDHCHALLDMRDNRHAYIVDRYPGALQDRLLKGLCETQAIWLQMGLIEIPGAEII